MNATHIKNESELKHWVSGWLPTRKPAQVVLLNGPMGVGKTRLVRFVCEALGAEAPSSPSFSIHNEYSTPEGDVDHLDLYRVESESDLESTGFWDLFEKPEGLIFVEWAERLGDARFSKGWSVVSLDMEFGKEDGSRTLTIVEIQ